jgi:hypothetical protein
MLPLRTLTIIAFSFFTVASKTYAQDAFIQSQAFMTTTYQGQQINATSEDAILVVQESSGVINIRIGFDGFQTGTDSLDRWLYSLRGKFFWFSGTIPAEQVQALDQENSIEFESNGTLGFTDRITADATIPMAAMKLAPTQGLLNGLNAWSDIRIACTFNIDPVVLGLKLKDATLQDPLVVAIKIGRVNPYVMGQRDITK